uniref:BUD13 homolog n=1 Tax=Strigamia maritima TaxID=126957 RepID=T1ITH9_STRMM
MASKSMDKYLRKYMSKEELSKKKKSKNKAPASNEGNDNKKNLWKIVDDDIDMKKIEGGTSDLFDLELGEDAPQIAGIVDERPVMIQAEERYGSYRWKSICADDEDQTNAENDGNIRKTARKSVKKTRNYSDSDQSPPRSSKKTSSRQRHDSASDSDMSPPRKTAKNDKNMKNDVEKRPTRQNSDSDLSPERNNENKTEKSRESRTESIKIEPRSGSDSDLSPPRMDNSVSGRGAVAILRERKTGKKQDLVEKERRIREKKAKQAEREAKYMKWGKGLKQIEMKDEKIQNDLKEMDKPLARYADDADLDKYLRAQERDGDPMLKYLKKKKPQQSNNPTVADDDDGKSRYTGSAPPNRFKIRPGFRWDGVDRSNGFERDRFCRLANNQTQELDAYKWSIEDM